MIRFLSFNVIFIAIKMLDASLKSLISLSPLTLFQLARAQREKREEREKEIDDWSCCVLLLLYFFVRSFSRCALTN